MLVSTAWPRYGAAFAAASFALISSYNSFLGQLAYRRPRQRRPDLDLSEIISCFPRRLLRKFFNSLSDSSGAPGNYCHMGVLKW